MKERDEIGFVARHYSKERFHTDEAWKRLGIGGAPWWRRAKVAAAVGATIFLSATAALVYHQYGIESSESGVKDEMERVLPGYAVSVIDFENTPLPQVIERIRKVYGVEIADVPEDAGEYSLSLHYSGNAYDLVEIINDTLGTEMKVEEQNTAE